MSDTMRAIVGRAYGDAGVLKVKRVPIPPLRPGTVRVAAVGKLVLDT